MKDNPEYKEFYNKALLGSNEKSYGSEIHASDTEES